MTNKVIGACALCGLEADLQQSHLIPAWAYRRIRESNKEKNGAVVNITSRGAHQTDKQIKKHLLCKDCEQRFGRTEGRIERLTRHGERKGEIALHGKVNPFHYHESCYACTLSDERDGIDLAYFAASVIWRTYPITGACPLGAYEPSFRRFLLGEQEFPANAAIVTGLYDTSPTTDMRGWITMPTSARVEGAFLHAFLFLGLNFRCWVGKEVPRRRITNSITSRDGPKLIISMPPEKSGDFKDAFDLAAVAVPRGKIKKIK